MAFMNQENKKRIAKILKEKLKDYKGKVKYTLSVRHHSSIVMTIKSGNIDFLKNYDDNLPQERKEDEYYDPNRTYLQVNPYHFESNFTGESLVFLKKAFEGLQDGNHDNSDIMTDYFDVGWYVDVNIGGWDKPFELTEN